MIVRVEEISTEKCCAFCRIQLYIHHMPLTNSIPIRLSPDVRQALNALRKETNVTTSALLRLAVQAGLPLITEQFGSKQANRRTSAATESAARRSTPRKRKEAA